LRLAIDSSRCTGCMNCQVVCALSRSGMQLPCSAAIRVNLDLFGGAHSHVFCRHCENPRCAEACPVSALVPSPSTGALEINTLLCVNCGSCAEACPWSAIFTPAELPFPVKCDLCEGSPKCAAACAFDAIEVEGIGE
jgi:anaerobic carbon-monoxide dehydrogenase iron sulfur subunit